LFYAGLKAPNFSRKYSIENGWTLELIELPQKEKTPLKN
jgi:nitrogen fixation protein